MPLMPKRVKYRKHQKRSLKGKAQSGSRISFGEFALQALERAWITNIQIEACRVAMTRAMSRKGKIWICVFPHHSRTKKPLETRMGKGKGAVDHWVATVKPGRILFEVDGVPHSVATEALRLAAAKLPIATRIVQRRHQV